MELTIEQIVILGVVASAITQILKLILAYWKGFTLTTRKVSFVVVVVSIILAVGFQYKEIAIGGPDPMELVISVVMASSQIVALAYLFYVWLLKYLVDALHLTEERMIKARD